MPTRSILLLSVACACAAQQSTLLVRGFPGAQGAATDPQGVPFFAAGGEVVQVLARNLTIPLARIGGHPVAMAFDRNGDLYVADRDRNALLKITPWGAVSVAASGLRTPAAIAVAPDGAIYFADTSGLYRLKDKPEPLAADLGEAKALAAAAARVFVSKGDAIWRITPDGKLRAKFAAPGAAAMAIDVEGNLYAAREGKLSVLSPEGHLIETYELPARHPAGLAFGGIDQSSLYLTDAETGCIYRLRARRRSQLFPWESDPPLAITEPVDGAVLNRNDGQSVAGGLRITLKGYSRSPGPVRINGARVPVDAGRFKTSIVLDRPENRIAASAGAQRHAITVLWDRNSFKRFRVSTDDNILWLRDIARHADTYQSIFENPYLSFWREMHTKYAAKIHHNIYYQTEGFNLSQMPGKFRPEWQRNADWMHLSFHARANDPDRPYLHASPERIRDDYRAVMREIQRFAGREVTSPVTTVHWGAITRAAARALRQEGVRTLVGYFEMRDELPSVCYFLPAAQIRYLMGRDYWKDSSEDLLFIRHDIVINTIPLAKIVPYLERIVADPHQNEVMELMIHEQYFYPDYRAYEPDYRERVETAIKFVVDHGYKPVFYGDGLAGAP